MADKSIGDLAVATQLDDSSLMVAEQRGTAVAVPGSLFKQFALNSVADQIGAAEQAAKDAETSAQEAQEARDSIVLD